MGFLKSVLLAVDRWQKRHPVVGRTYAVIKKFGDDQANLLVVALGWYGFTAIYPLLLVVVTILGFIGAPDLSTNFKHTLTQFPVIGKDFVPTKGASNLHGSVPGLVVGLAGLLYGAQGVTQTAQQAMAQVWNVPRIKLPGFLARLGRSLLGLVIIGGAFVLNAFLGSVAAGYGQRLVLRIAVIAGLVLMNVGLYWAAFVVLTPPHTARPRQFLPGAIVGGVGFTLLTTVGTGLVQHQIRHTSDTYGAFASIIGVVAYLLLLAKLTVYGAELNPVVAQGLSPRALPGGEPTEADNRVLRQLAYQERQRPDEHIDVDFDPARGDARGAAGGDAAGDHSSAGRNLGGNRTDWSTPPSATRRSGRRN